MLKELSEDLNSIKKIQSLTKDILIEVKNKLQGKNSRVDETNNQIDDLEHKDPKSNQSEQQEKKESLKKIEDSISSLWDNLKHSNSRIIRVPKGEEKEQEVENKYEKIIKENFPNLVNEIDIQVQEAHRVPNKMDAKRPTLNHIIIQMPKVKYKERILKRSKRMSGSKIYGTFTQWNSMQQRERSAPTLCNSMDGTGEHYARW